MNYYDKILRDEIGASQGLGRFCTWQIGTHSSSSPLVFLGIDAFNAPFPWKKGLDVPGILLNSLDLLSSSKFEASLKEESSLSLHQYFEYPKLIMMDSGGFKVLELYSRMRKDKRRLLSGDILRTCLQLYGQTDPDLVVIPDLPYHPEVRLSENLERMKRNIDHICRFPLEGHLLRNTIPIPVFHPFPHPFYHRKLLKKMTDAASSPGLSRILEKAPALGIGGLVPYFLNRKGKGYFDAIKIIDFLCWMRLAFPNKLLHIFGVGGSSMMLVLFYLGIDSLDTMGWRVRAAFSKIQLLGRGDYSAFGTRSWKSKSIYEDKIARRLIVECECPACQRIRSEGWDLGFYQMKANPSLSFELRALHNAYTYLQLAKRTQAILKEGGNLEKHIIDNIRGNSFALSLFRTAKRVVRKYHISKGFGWV